MHISLNIVVRIRSRVPTLVMFTTTPSYHAFLSTRGSCNDIESNDKSEAGLEYRSHMQHPHLLPVV